MKQLVPAFTKALLKGDVQFATELYTNEIESKVNQLTFFESVVKPSMYRIGDLWEKNQITVAEEHLATATLKYLLSSMYTPYEVSERRPKGLLFCIEGEQHTLGLEFANEIFKELQWNTRYLGANVPVKDAVTFVKAWEPQAVVISIGMTTAIPSLRECLEQIEDIQPDVKILVGGRLISHYNLEFLKKESINTFHDLIELHDYLEEHSEQFLALLEEKISN
ncbi:cobalamin-dependent protein [Rossellomorea aquimaris]|uniref:cobalamin B12-binding domain-containing protein n=1 Tax=Rossellomorea aquimaris TaxID=189382 RepID=UPI001CD74D24|nr:cobalamin-dependent protein [Rossellomorea aquimaris]MCA1055990.1 cobalamin-dependent protein [Rossellomorea aquimaris]